MFKNKKALIEKKNDLITRAETIVNTAEDEKRELTEDEAAELAEAVNRFVRSLPLMERRIFLCLYWYLEGIGDISRRFGFSQSKVKMILLRQRKKLQAYLEKEALL